MIENKDVLSFVFDKNVNQDKPVRSDENKENKKNNGNKQTKKRLMTLADGN